MNPKKPASPQTIALMIGGIVIALGFAIWNINNALGSGSPPAKTETAATTQPAQTAATPTSVAQATGAPSTTAQGEATLAPSADPFMPLPPQVPTAPVANNMAQASPPSGASGGLPSIPPMRADIRPLGLTPPAIERDPELVGTLLGGRPSAVLRTEKQLATVPVGGKVGSWKVVAVSHGEAVLRTVGRTLHLGVSRGQAMGSVRVSAEPAPSIAEKKVYHAIPQVAAATTQATEQVTEPDRQSLPDALPAGNVTPTNPADGSSQPVKMPETPVDPAKPPMTDDKSAAQPPSPGTPQNPAQPAPGDKPPTPGAPQPGTTPGRG